MAFVSPSIIYLNTYEGRFEIDLVTYMYIVAKKVQKIVNFFVHYVNLDHLGVKTTLQMLRL